MYLIFLKSINFFPQAAPVELQGITELLPHTVMRSCTISFSRSHYPTCSFQITTGKVQPQKSARLKPTFGMLSSQISYQELLAMKYISQHK